MEISALLHSSPLDNLDLKYWLQVLSGHTYYTFVFIIY